jgi:hypothetical protein
MEMRRSWERGAGGNGLQASIHLRIVSRNYRLGKQYSIVIRMMGRKETEVLEVAGFEGVAGAADSNELWKSRTAAQHLPRLLSRRRAVTE